MTMVSYKEIRDGLIRVRVLEHYDEHTDWANYFNQCVYKIIYKQR